MKYIILILLLSVSFCFSQTQTELNQEAGENYKKADKELNSIYNKILSEYRNDKKFIQKLRAAQKAWIIFRDAEMIALYPEEDNYGSVFPMCWNITLTELTKERTKKLKAWLNGIEEGDVCAGSIKIKK